jgi:transposase
VKDVELKLSEGQILIEISHDRRSELRCPKCGSCCPGYDEVERRWRHLDTCQYETILRTKVPRVNCKEHKVQQVQVPWAEKGSRLTLLFESLIIDWLREASISAVSKHLGLSWKQVDGVMQRAVKRGLLRREKQRPTRLGIDETSFQKRHEYVTVVTDMDQGHVVDVIDDRKKEPLEKCLKSLGKEVLSGIECVAMDMHRPFIEAVKKVVPDAGKKIAFDKFHVIAHLTKAVNQVRRQENAALLEDGEERLKGSRFLWITAKENLTEQQEVSFEAIRDIAVKTSQAWMMKEMARQLWSYSSKAAALKAWKKWVKEALESELTPIKRTASMILNHLQGIIVAILLKATNAKAEAMNNKIQHIKKIAYGFRNRKRFKNSILFHLGGLDLYPIQSAK